MVAAKKSQSGRNSNWTRFNLQSSEAVNPLPGAPTKGQCKARAPHSKLWLIVCEILAPFFAIGSTGNTKDKAVKNDAANFSGGHLSNAFSAPFSEATQRVLCLSSSLKGASFHFAATLFFSRSSTGKKVSFAEFFGTTLPRREKEKEKKGRKNYCIRNGGRE